MKIHNFDPNNIKIQDDEFFLKSLIRFYPVNIKFPISGGGHYTCIKRINHIKPRRGHLKRFKNMGKCL